MQNINLLCDQLLPKREYLPLHQVAIAWGGLALVLVAISLVDWMNLYFLEGDRGNVSISWLEIQKASSKFRASFSTIPNPELLSEVQRLRGEFTERQHLMELLAEPDGAELLGFSTYLDDLSVHSVSGLWLKQIGITDGGQKITLAGETLEAVSVPQLLIELAKGTGFKGHRFDQFELREGGNGVLEFRITGPEYEQNVELDPGSLRAGAHIADVGSG